MYQFDIFSLTNHCAKCDSPAKPTRIFEPSVGKCW